MNTEQKNYLGFTIRNAQASDIPLIQELSYTIWPQTYSAILSKAQMDYMMDMMYSNASLINQLSNGFQYILVYDEMVAIGYASYKDISNDNYKLDKIYILPSQQRKGIGKFVMNHILTQIKKEGGANLQLQVNRANKKARFFYEKIGFALVKEIDVEIGNGFVMDDYILEKKL